MEMARKSSKINRSLLKPGIKVLYHSITGYPGKEYTVRSEPWQLGSGEWVVLLDGISGGVAVDHISKVVEG